MTNFKDQQLYRLTIDGKDVLGFWRRDDGRFYLQDGSFVWPGEVLVDPPVELVHLAVDDFLLDFLLNPGDYDDYGPIVSVLKEQVGPDEPPPGASRTDKDGRVYVRTRLKEEASWVDIDTGEFYTWKHVWR